MVGNSNQSTAPYSAQPKKGLSSYVANNVNTTTILSENINIDVVIGRSAEPSKKLRGQLIIFWTESEHPEPQAELSFTLSPCLEKSEFKPQLRKVTEAHTFLGSL